MARMKTNRQPYHQRARGGTPARAASRSQVRPLLQLGAIAVLLVAVWLGWKGWQVYTRAEVVRQDVRELDALTKGQTDGETLDVLAHLLPKTRRDVAALRQEMALFLPLTPYLEAVPVYGTDIAHAGPLLDAATAGTVAADEAFAALLPIAQNVDTSNGLSLALLQDVSHELAAARPGLEQASRSLDRATSVWPTIPVEKLSPRLRSYAQRADPLLALLEATVTLAIAADEVDQPLLTSGSLATSLPDEPTVEQIAALAEQVHAVRTQLEQARPFVARASTAWAQVPRDRMPASVRTRLDQVEPLIGLLHAGVEAQIALDDTATALLPVLQPRETSTTSPSSLTGALIQSLVAQRPAMEQANASLQRATEAWEAVAVDDLPLALSERVQALPSLLSLASDGVELGLLLPDLPGAQGKGEYLLIAQNTDEVAATGGYIGTVGVLTFEDGRLADYWIDNTDYKHGEYPRPPAAFTRYMGIDLWIFRHGNWSPDFPTTARTLRYLYRAERGYDASRIISVTPTAIQYLLDALGPVTVEGYPDAISSTNVIQYLRDEYFRKGHDGSDPNAFMDRLLQAMLARIEQPSSGVNVLHLSRAMGRALDERHLLLSLDDPQAMTFLARNDWDGAVRAGAGDFLMVVDTNMSVSRNNMHMQQAISYTVDVRDPAAPHAILSVQHTHTYPLGIPPDCRLGSYRDLPLPPPQTYAEAQGRDCYWNYMRVLVPEGSRLVGMEQHPPVNAAATSFPVPWNPEMLLSNLDDGSVQQGPTATDTLVPGTTPLGTFMIVAPGETRETLFRYQLPRGVVVPDEQGWLYQLKVQKQAGTLAVPLTVRVVLPPSARLDSSSLPPTSSTSTVLMFDLPLDTDQTLDVRFSASG